MSIKFINFIIDITLSSAVRTDLLTAKTCLGLYPLFNKSFFDISTTSIDNPPKGDPLERTITFDFIFDYYNKYDIKKVVLKLKSESN